MNENEYTTYLYVWDIMKVVLRGKFITLSPYIEKWERSHTSSWTEHLKALEQKEQITVNAKEVDVKK